MTFYAHCMLSMQVEKLIRDLQAEYGWDRWQPGSPEYEAGFRKLCEQQKSGLQRKTAKEVQTLLYTEESFKRHDGDQVTKKLRTIKERQQRKVASALEAWFEWDHALTHAGGLTPGHASVPSPAQIADAYKGNYPWAAGEMEGDWLITLQCSKYFCIHPLCQWKYGLNCADDLVSFWHLLVCHVIVNVNCIMFTFISPGPNNQHQLFVGQLEVLAGKLAIADCNLTRAKEEKELVEREANGAVPELQKQLDRIDKCLEVNPLSSKL
jgi:hypothetical protein